MADISSISSGATAIQSLSNLILVTPQLDQGYRPQSPVNPDGTAGKLLPTFFFDYEGEQVSTLDSDITDHFIEDNTAIQDHIAIKPEMFTTHGYVGELNDLAPRLLQPIKTAADRLTAISAYAPVLSQTALLAYDNAKFAYDTARNAIESVSSWTSINGSQTVIGSAGLISEAKNQTKQQRAYVLFYQYWRTRTLFTIQTPWAIFQNCAIKTLRAIQDAESESVSDFEVTFKVIRFAKLQQTIAGATTQASGRAAIQSASETDQGITTGVDDPIGFESRLV